jgi:hypothetical protein
MSAVALAMVTTMKPVCLVFRVVGRIKLMLIVHREFAVGTTNTRLGFATCHEGPRMGLSI